MGLVLCLMLLSGCNLRPKYVRPKEDVKLEGRDGKKSAVEVSWKDFYVSQELQEVIGLALEHNKDLRIAVLNIEAARASYGIKRADLMPTINATGSVTKQGAPSAFALFTPATIYRGGLNLASYEVDLFGKLRNLKDAAYQNYLGTAEAKNVAEITLISQVASAYVQLLVDESILRLLNEMEVAQGKKASLAKYRLENGRAQRVDALLAEADLENIKVMQASYRSIVELDKNALMLLTGVFDESKIPRGKLEDMRLNEKLFSMVPSEVLLNRPDIRQAEYNLIGANANIGAARAAFFPSLSITGSYGYGSRAFGELFNSRQWAYTPQLTVPIFSGFRNKSNLDLAHVQKNIQIVAYEKVIQTAFKEVLDELSKREAIAEKQKLYRGMVGLKEQSYKIVEQQYESGKNDMFTVVNYHVDLLTLQQSVYSVQGDYLINLISLYKVFGGGALRSDQPINGDKK